MVTIFGHTFEHLTIIREIGNPVIAYAVQTESGWCIRKASFSANVYKTATAIYATDDLDAIEIVQISELPEDAVVNGTTNRPEVM